MKKRFIRAAFVLCLLGTPAMLPLTAQISPAYAAEKKVSKPVGQLLAAAQKLMEANDFNSALPLIKQAQALPDQTPYDTYKINEFLGNVAVRLNDHVTAEQAFAALADSPELAEETPEMKAQNLRIATLLAVEQKHYANGIKYGTAHMALGGTPDALVLASMAQAYYYMNDFTSAEATAQKAVAATPATEPPNRGAMEIIFGAQIKANKQAEALKTLEKILTYYDDPDEWAQLVDVSIGTKGIKSLEALHMYRLRIVTNATAKSPDDFATAAALANELAYPVEADAIIAKARAAGFGGGKVGQLAASIGPRAAKDRASIASFDALARKSASGDLDLRLAETYYGYGKYAEAAEAARRAIQKGTKVDLNEANLVLGEALLLSGDKAGAIAALNNVKGSEAMQRAAHIWLVYANRNTAPKPQ